MVQYTNRTYICMVFTTQFAETCRVSMRFIYNIVRVVAANAKAAAARAKLAIAEQIPTFREKWEMVGQSVTTPFGNRDLVRRLLRDGAWRAHKQPNGRLTFTGWLIDSCSYKTCAIFAGSTTMDRSRLNAT